MTTVDWSGELSDRAVYRSAYIIAGLIRRHDSVPTPRTGKALVSAWQCPRGALVLYGGAIVTAGTGMVLAGCHDGSHGTAVLQPVEFYT